MHGFWQTVRISLLDMRGDMRRFFLLIACLAVGTALIAGVSSVGASIRQAVDRDAAVLMGGDIELTRADRQATPEELALIGGYGQVAYVVDTNVRGEANGKQSFVDLIAVGETYPLLGQVYSPQMPFDTKPFDFLGWNGEYYGALVDPLMLDQLGASVGGVIQIGGTPFEVRGALGGVPDAPVRGFRLGVPVVITTEALAILGDRTSPLPGLGTFFHYKVLLNGMNAEEGKAAVEAALGDPAWTVRSARDGLGPMVRYYDLFMRFLMIVGLASLLIGGVSVWTGISAYVAERSTVIAILRSLGADGGRVFTHFFTQIAALAAMGVGIGLIVGGGAALVALPIVGQAVGVDLPMTLHAQPLLIAAGVGLIIAFAFSYLPLLQALVISPVTLFRAKGLAAQPIEWARWLRSIQIVPLIAAAAVFFWLATLMTGDALIVLGFAVGAVISVVIFRVAIAAAMAGIQRLPDQKNTTLRNALRGIAGAGSNAPSVVVSVGLALATLVVVLVLQLNLSNEYLGASVFDAPTFVASDLFDDEAANIEALEGEGRDITLATATPMLRGLVTAVNGNPTSAMKPRGPEASFLLSGEVPMTFRSALPANSKIVAGDWWPADYAGPPLVSLHESLRNGLGINLGDEVTFTIFGDPIKAKVASFRSYSWQGGIDFLVTFSPGVIEAYPTTLLAAVTAAPGREQDVERTLATTVPDIYFIPIGATLERIAIALSQLSLAASLVGGIAVGNGLLVLIGSLATGRRQRQADAVITRVLGASRGQVLASAVLRYILLSVFAAILATPIGIGLAWILATVLLDVEFTVDPTTLLVVEAGAILFTGILGATTIIRGLRSRSALFLRELGAE
jgi:putative ABC transport system permease protein